MGIFLSPSTEAEYKCVKCTYQAKPKIMKCLQVLESIKRVISLS